MNAREKAFVNAYLGDCNGNGTHAAIAAGYAKGSAHVTASQLLRKPKVAAAIAARQAKRENKAILTADQRDEILSQLALAVKTGPVGRIKAISELNKCSGRHSSTVHLNGKLTLEEALAASHE